MAGILTSLNRTAPNTDIDAEPEEFIWDDEEFADDDYYVEYYTGDDDWMSDEEWLVTPAPPPPDPSPPDRALAVAGDGGWGVAPRPV